MAYHGRTPTCELRGAEGCARSAGSGGIIGVVPTDAAQAEALRTGPVAEGLYAAAQG